MKYSLIINQVQALELGITNINQAHIFDLLTTASIWATPEIVNKEVFYWVARQTIADELKLLNLKPDTVYRHLKSLQDLKLIEYIKVGKKDCIKVTNLGKKYTSKIDNSTMSEINPNYYVGNKSEKNSKLGNKSEKNSEINPTYHTTNNNHTTNNVSPAEIINFYKNNISSKHNYVKEQKSFNEITKSRGNEIHLILNGLKNYKNFIDTLETKDKKYIKSLNNFIADKTYLDYQKETNKKAYGGYSW